ncbi:MAG: prepilin-type N-terminal cleavage/methylation domain-containing protein [Candidatus Pacebacteria bacterium]|nr:prepilin-type N-terminal cleavage/methylation domain-containing protein [Candidatus Paceibacterota bacterium]
MDKSIKLAFTLIELLVVIAIIGILSGLIVVTMNGVTAKANIAKSQVFSNSLRNALMLNLISEWKLDNGSGTTIADSWNGGNGGTISGFTDTTAGYGDTHGSGWMSSSNCISGTCLKFDGSNDYINVIDNSNLDSNSITVSAWIKIGDSLPGDWGTIIAKGYQSDNNHFWLCYRTNSGFMFEFGNGTTRSAAYYNITPALNTWYYVVGTYVSGFQYIYVNGVKGAQQTFIGNLGTNSYPLIMGKASYASNYYWTGIIDEVRFFNANLPSSQIREHYYSGLNNLLINGSMSKKEYLSRINDYAIDN